MSIIMNRVPVKARVVKGMLSIMDYAINVANRVRQNGDVDIIMP